MGKLMEEAEDFKTGYYGGAGSRDSCFCVGLDL